MAERLGDDTGAEHWFREGLRSRPDDFYMRAACADLLLRQGRAAETLQLLAGLGAHGADVAAHRHRAEAAGRLRRSRAAPLLSTAFAAEQQRGEAVHRREQARFLLDVEEQPAGGARRRRRRTGACSANRTMC